MGMMNLLIIAPNCQLARCGDGIVHAGVEACDTEAAPKAVQINAPFALVTSVKDSSSVCVTRCGNGTKQMKNANLHSAILIFCTEHCLKRERCGDGI